MTTGGSGPLATVVIGQALDVLVGFLKCQTVLNQLAIDSDEIGNDSERKCQERCREQRDTEEQ